MRQFFLLLGILVFPFLTSAMTCEGESFLYRNKLKLVTEVGYPYTKFLIGHKDFLNCPDGPAIPQKDAYLFFNATFDDTSSGCHWPGGSLKVLALLNTSENANKATYTYSTCSGMATDEECEFKILSYKIVIDTLSGDGALYSGGPTEDGGETWFQYTSEFNCTL